jgi:hypothetical protein
LPSVKRNHVIGSIDRAFSFHSTNGKKQKNRQKALLPRPFDGYRVQNKNASIVLILTFLFGGGEGNRTPVRKLIRIAFYGCIPFVYLPCISQTDKTDTRQRFYA